MALESGPIARVVEIDRDEFILKAEQQKEHGIFGLDDLTEGKAREFKLKALCEEIQKYDRGWEGNSRQCPKCGKQQIYKGDSPRKLRVSGGTIEVDRAYYVCKECKHSSFPLDETLNLAPELEQGRLREKISILGALISYHQIPEVSRSLLGFELAPASARISLLREAELVEEKCPKKVLTPTKEDTLYVEIDGFMCPTREPRKDGSDQGFREAKIIQAFLGKDRAETSEERIEILDQLIEAKICDIKQFRPIVKDLLQRADLGEAKQVVVLADGAKWIWNLADTFVRGAIQILDYTHAKQHLFNFAKILYGEGKPEVFALVRELKGLLLDDQIETVITKLESLAGINPELKKEANYFRNNKKRMRYKTFKDQGLAIGSGAVESAGKRLAQGRVKGAGMRWNVKDLNPVLMFRAALFERRLLAHFRRQRTIETEYFQKLAA